MLRREMEARRCPLEPSMPARVDCCGQTAVPNPPNAVIPAKAGTHDKQQQERCERFEFRVSGLARTVRPNGCRYAKTPLQHPLPICQFASGFGAWRRHVLCDQHKSSTGQFPARSAFATARQPLADPEIHCACSLTFTPPPLSSPHSRAASADPAKTARCSSPSPLPRLRVCLRRQSARRRRRLRGRGRSPSRRS